MKRFQIMGSCLICIFLFSFEGVHGQGTAADYERADRVSQQANDQIFDAPRAFHWSTEEKMFWYVNKRKDGKVYLKVDPEKRKKEPLFDHHQLAKRLAQESGEKVKAEDLPIDALEFTAHSKMTFEAFGKSWALSLDDYTLNQLGEKGRSEERSGGYWGDAYQEKGRKTTSPDKQWVAYTKDFNLYIKKTADDEQEIQMSFDGGMGKYYSDEVFWSPDSKNLVALRVTPNVQRKIYFVESSPESQRQPILHSRNYLKPGDALPQKQPVLFDIEKKESFAVDPTIILNQYSIDHISWREDSRAYTFEYNQRGHQLYQVFSVDRKSGETTPIITEKSKTFFSYNRFSGKKYRKDVQDGREIIWASERDGWNHLYLYDGATGKVKNQITQGEWVVREVVHVDQEQRSIIFAGSGKEEGQDPYFIQYYKVNFDGSGLTALTHENANHNATFSSDYTTFVDSYSRVDSPQTTVLRSVKNGNVLMELEQADVDDLLASGWKYPEVFHAKGRDKVTDIWGIIVRPSNFDPQNTYPVIEYIYAGPQGSFVPKNFGAYPHLAALAELGFIVVQIDGMGTSNRSKKFHDVSYKNLKDGGFPDRILWMKEAAKKYPYMDLNRVGIFGTSAGGQNSTAGVLFHPEFYKVAVSSAGSHDNRMDKLWWNEQYMGYPIGPQYAESSNVDNAYRLQGRLMLIVGEMDDNVDPSTTMQVVNALIKADKDFELVFVPGAGHGSGGSFGERKRRDFFVKNLLGVDPPVWEHQKEILPH